MLAFFIDVHGFVSSSPLRLTCLSSLTYDTQRLESAVLVAYEGFLHEHLMAHEACAFGLNHDCFLEHSLELDFARNGLGYSVEDCDEVIAQDCHIFGLELLQSESIAFNREVDLRVTFVIPPKVCIQHQALLHSETVETGNDGRLFWLFRRGPNAKRVVYVIHHFCKVVAAYHRFPLAII